MAQKVFFLESIVDPDLSGSSSLISDYWGDQESIKFIAHMSYLYRIASKKGYLAIKILKIKKPDLVDVRWVSVDKNDALNIENSLTSARYFVIKKEALEHMIEQLDTNANSIGVEIGKGLNAENKTIYYAIIGAGKFEYVLGGGGNSPTAGAKLP